MVEKVIGLHVKHPYSCLIFIKIEFSQQIFEKFSNIKFHENPSRRNQVVPCRQQDRRTDGHNKASSHFSQFRKQIMKEHRG